MKKLHKKRNIKKTMPLSIIIGLFVIVLLVAVYFLNVYFNNRDVLAAPSNLYSNLTADLKPDRATFNFNYSGSVLYKDLALYYIVDTSLGGKFTNAEWKTKDWVVLGTSANTTAGTPPPLPIVIDNPKSIWDKYACGSLIYWRIRAVVTKNVVNTSPIQQTVVDCSTTP